MYGRNRTLVFPYSLNDTAAQFACDLHSKRYARDVCAFELSLVCSENFVGKTQCATLFNYAEIMLRREEEAAIANLPAVQASLRSERPFYFLHLEKTAGTCLRHHLAKKYINGSSRAIIPCHYGLPCMTFTLDRNDTGAFLGNNSAYLDPYMKEPPMIVAGHFDWGVWDVLGTSSNDVVCYTTVRHPIRRILSLYYERLFPQTLKRFALLTVDELQFYLLQWRGSAHGRWRDEGMSNAACRMLCGQNRYKGRLPHSVSTLDAEDLCTIDIARQRLSTCIVGMQ